VLTPDEIGTIEKMLQSQDQDDLQLANAILKNRSSLQEIRAVCSKLNKEQTTWDFREKKGVVVRNNSGDQLRLGME
jgi:hypothetical protein